MSVGYAGGGLDDPGFDEDAAAKNLTDFGSYGPADTSVDAVSGGAPTAPGVTPAPGPAGPELMAPDLGPETQEAPGLPPVPQPASPPSSSPSAAAEQIGQEQLKPPPALTGDPQKDGAALVEYQRYLADRHVEVTAKQSQIKQQEAVVGQMKSKKELEAAQHAVEQRQAEIARYAKERADRQATIEEAIKERIAARKSLESGPDKLHGGQIVAAIFGAIGASLQNMAAVQAGHGGNFENQALNVIQAKFKQQYDRRLERLKTAGDELLMARYGAKDSEEAHRAALNDLDAKTAAEYKLAEKEALDHLAKLGVDKATAESNEVVVKLREGEAQHEEQIHQREEGMAGQRAQAAATLELAEANLGERKGEFRANLGERREEFKLRREDAATAREDRKAAQDEKKQAKQDTDWASRAVKDPDTGAIINYAATPRQAPQANKDERTFVDAEKSLRELIAYQKEHQVVGRLPVGDRYNRAVLAVAATTTANASDKTTKHEEDTLKNIGLSSPDAAQRTLEHIKERHDAFRRQLVTRPGEGESEMVPSPVAAKNAPAKAPPKAPKLNGADAERMLKANKAGDHRFDGILKQYNLL